MNDEGFREIQLNGKQLVFLFMAATVVSVVIFLCGVLVGRGVRGTAPTVEMTSAEVGPDPGQTAPAENTLPPPPTISAPSGAPASPGDEAPGLMSYTDRLLKDTNPEENLKPTPAAPAVRPPPPSPPAPARGPAAKEAVVVAQAPAAPPDPPAAAAPAVPAATPAAASTPTDPSGPGFAVQVAAYRDRREADTLAKQLVAKGYPAFVMDPVKGAPTEMFRVRVGKYKTRKDAEAVSARLQTAEQFKPWIAR